MTNQLMTSTAQSHTQSHTQSRTQSRTSTGQGDLPAIVAFYALCDRVDQLDNAPTLTELQRRLDHPPPDGIHQRQLWETADGQLVGLVSLWLDDPTDELEGWVGVFVHPDWRGNQLEADLLSWAEHHVRDQAAIAHLPARLHAGVRLDAPYYRAIYETASYGVIRQFHIMQRPLTDLAELIPPPQFPEGFTARETNSDEAEAWIAMFNESFVDHWHFTPMTLRDRQFRLTYPTYQPELDWVAVAPDGTLVGFCGAEIDREENALKNRQEGWIALLGTRRGYRRQGLARAMLRQGLHQLQAAGMETALLGVDSQNPNQAKRLYESAGFQVKETSLTYQKLL